MGMKILIDIFCSHILDIGKFSFPQRIIDERNTLSIDCVTVPHKWSLVLYLSYEERLKECGLTTLETRRLRGDQVEVFMILNGCENIDRNMFFSFTEDCRTRGYQIKLVNDQCRVDISKHSFSQRTINEWNKLSTDCVTASSVNMFKNKVDTYLRRAGYK